MKRFAILLFIVVLIGSNVSIALANQSLTDSTLMVIKVDEDVFRSVEQMPQFPGGEAALMEHISTHTKYPPTAVERNIQGKVIVQFIVEKDGSVGDVKVARSVDEDLDQEAIRVVKTLPNFIPGRQDNQVVRVWYTIPISFKLKQSNAELTDSAGFAQTQATATQKGNDKTSETDHSSQDKDKIHRSVTQMPQFPGGEEAMMKHLISNINYPENAAKNNIQGRVLVQFVVEKDGSIGEVKVVRSINEDLDREAIRVVKTLPKFTTPGLLDGEPARVWMTFPITFKQQSTRF